MNYYENGGIVKLVTETRIYNLRDYGWEVCDTVERKTYLMYSVAHELPEILILTYPKLGFKFENIGWSWDII